MSEFPQIINTISQFVDLITPLDDSHMNALLDEITAIQTALEKVHNAEVGYTYDRDFIEGLDCRWASNSGITISSGAVCISGCRYTSSGVISINTTDNMRDGESVLDNCLYYAYAYINSGEVAAEFSTTDPSPDLRHPADKSRRVCGFIRRAGGVFLAYRAYGETVIVPTPVLWGGSVMANPANIDLSEYVPPSVVEIKMAGYMTSNSGRTARWYLSPDSALYWPLTTLVMLFYQVNDVHNFDVFLSLTERAFDYQLQAGNYGGLYLSEIRWKRKRY